MNQSNRENVVVMHAHTHSSVISMPSRERALRSSAAVVQMPSRLAQESDHSASVVTMPSRAAQPESGTAKNEEPALGHLSSAFRLTLLALFTWLGWPRPTHGKDPGAAGARPWKPAFLSAISTLHLPTPAFAAHKQAAIFDFPATAAGQFEANSVVNLRAA